MNSVREIVTLFMKYFLHFLSVAVVIFGVSIFVGNSRNIANLSSSTRKIIANIPEITNKKDVIEETNRRVSLYEQNIKEKHLLDGMVVNRSVSGAAINVCDSLLFSSIRYVALKKLGKEYDAQIAWDSIVNSQKESGRWVRHPKCQSPLSRDMMVGVLLALSQNPINGRIHLAKTLKFVKENKGYFDDGPIYLSYLTPSLAETMRKMSQLNQIHSSHLPKELSAGFSTIELNGIFLDPGYRSHLTALLVWLELEQRDKYSKSQMITGHRSPIFEMSKLLESLTPVPLYDQRLQWVTMRLIELNPKNMFYRWLYLKSIGIRSQSSSIRLLSELNDMPQFPKGGLPLNCDRKADYLWQRIPKEYTEKSRKCSKHFSGLDYIWMASLLLDDIRKSEDEIQLAH